MSITITKQHSNNKIMLRSA